MAGGAAIAQILSNFVPVNNQTEVKIVQFPQIAVAIFSAPYLAHTADFIDFGIPGQQTRIPFDNILFIRIEATPADVPTVLELVLS